ncbi:hypothetical protein TSUD_138990 [Trifolium subterraneum]|uniref:Reverse transcriptase domain-containing protein n=1 Tax=Trifolium subterraneum TaxID=3900 RepID=A0A2Z6NL98_TRISU|nr:hypothetical protein TSUD_138990 [Trifolium subterraneum]
MRVGSSTLEGVAPIRLAVESHLTSHFKADSIERPGVDNLIFKQLKPAEVSSLIKPFSLEEVKAAVWDCDSYKSPSPDGVNFGFIKDFWEEMKGDIMRFIVEFHRNDKFTKGLNATFIITLIPKCDLGISNCVLKDRQILDGILIANEVVDEARRAKNELMMFKVDFEKAVMGRMGFPTLWRKWIKECICTATTPVLVNGSPIDEFPLERGLRQGDPLSPFSILNGRRALTCVDGCNGGAELIYWV